MKKVQAILYKFIDKKLHYLCLKWSEVDGGFWHVVTGTPEQGETDEECLKREILEELGESIKILKISSILKQWIWDKGFEQIPTNDYALEVSDDLIKLNEEHTEYKWLNKEEAFSQYKYNSAKEMIGLTDSYLENR